MNGNWGDLYGRRVVPGILVCLISLLLYGCLESDEPPKLSPTDLVQIASLDGIFKAFPDGEGKEYRLFHRFIPQPNKRYVIQQVKMDLATHKAEPDPGTLDLALVALSREQGMKSFLAVISIPPSSNDKRSQTLYYELRQEGERFSWGYFELSRDQGLAAAGSAFAKKKGVSLVRDELKGRLTAKTLKELFSESTFRSALKIEYEPLQAISSEEKEVLAAAGYSPTGGGDASKGMESLQGTGPAIEKKIPSSPTQTASVVASLISQLQSKVSAEGPFDQAWFGRVSMALVAADPVAASTQELLANATDFAEGKVRASMFVAYLKEALPLVEASKPKELGGLAWLQAKANEGDWWAKFFLARAHFYSAAKFQAQAQNERFEGQGFPQDTLKYWDIYKQVVQDDSFAGSYSEVVRLSQEGVKTNFAPLVNLLGALQFNGLGMSKDERKGLTLYRQAADGGFAIAMSNLAAAYQNGAGVIKDEAEAVRWYRQAADRGHAGAMNQLGNAYIKGRGVAKDEAEAVHWYRKAADLGQKEAMFNLGVNYANGEGVAKDETQAASWYRKAADLGDSDSMFELGRGYAKGLGVTKDVTQAVQWFRKAAELGQPEAAHEMSVAYKNGYGVQQSDAEGVRWLRTAAELNNRNAMVDLGVVYAKGLWGITKNEAEAVQWFRKAAELGQGDAAYEVGKAYANGQGGVTKDEAEAVRWYRKAADLGSPAAMFALGVSYTYGNGVAKDEAEAMRWYRNGAELGNKDAMYGLALLTKDPAIAVQWQKKAANLGQANAAFALGAAYTFGRGVAKDAVEAAGWYRKAADFGEVKAMFVLGRVYANGQGVAKDEAESVRWYLRAAEGGHVEAMSSVGLAYLNGEGVPKNDAEAFKWFQKATANGDSSGMVNLGYMYGSGRGVGRDDAEAVRWYQKAAALGAGTAMSNLGAHYETGAGVAKDLKQALEWYQKAAGLGNENAKQAIQRLQAAASGTAATSNQGVGTTTGWRSAQEWADAYRNAPVISKADFLKLVKSVRLSFSVSPELEQHVSPAKLLERVRNAIEREGVRIDEKAPVTIKVKWGFEHHTVTKSTERTGGYGYSREEQKHTVLLFSSLLQFELTTPLYRNGRFYNRRVIPTSSWSIKPVIAGDDAIKRGIREDGVDGLAEGIADIFADIRKSTTIRNNGGTLQWGVDENMAMFKSYTDAKQVGSDDLDRVFTEVNGISELDIDLAGDAGMFVNKTNVHNRWANTMPDAKWSYIENGTGTVYHKLALLKINASKLQTLFSDLFYIPFGVMLSNIVIKEDNTIEMDGRLFRIPNIKIWEEFKLTGALWDQVDAAFPNLAYASIRDAISEVRYRR